MTKNTLIMYDNVSRPDIPPVGGPSGWTWSIIAKFNFFYSVSIFENLSPNQDFGSSESEFLFMEFFGWMDGEIVGRKVFSIAARNCATYRSFPRSRNVIGEESSILVPMMQPVRNSGALSLEPFEMSGLNFQVSTRCWDTGSVGARKIE
jgi:hypothetical protein